LAGAGARRKFGSGIDSNQVKVSQYGKPPPPENAICLPMFTFRPFFVFIHILHLFFPFIFLFAFSFTFHPSLISLYSFPRVEWGGGIFHNVEYTPGEEYKLKMPLII
jgi:hypothetical protein